MRDLGLAVAVVLGSGIALPPEPFWDHFDEVSEIIYGLPDTRLLLIQLDVTDDGRKEIFLAPSGKCGNGGCPWFVYSPSESPNEVRYLGEVAFSPGGYRFADGVLSLCWHMSAGECAWGRYTFGGGEVVQLTGRTCTFEARSRATECDREIEAIREWQQTSAPPLSWAPATPGELHWQQDGQPADSDQMPEFDSFVVLNPEVRR